MKMTLQHRGIVLAAMVALAHVSVASASTSRHRHVTSVSDVNAEDTDLAPLEHPLGAGVMIGSMDGISGKYWQNRRNAIDGGFSYMLNDYAALHGDYLWSVADLFGIQDPQKPHDSRTTPYFGIGAIVYFDTTRGSNPPDSEQLFTKLKSSGMALGARIPLGLEFQPGVIPCGIFGEVAPGAVLIPGMISTVQTEAGVRFYL